jgi:hypothetical protein
VLSIVIESGVQQDATPAGAPARSEKTSNAQQARESEIMDRAVRERNNAAPEMSGLANAPYFVTPDASVENDAAVHKEVTVAAQRIEESLQTTPSPVAAVSAVEIAPPPSASATAPASEPPVARTEETAVSTTAEPNSAAGRDASASAEFDQIAVTSSKTRREPERTVGPRGTILARTSSQLEAGSSADTKYADPRDWLEAIRELREQGRAREADEEWERFRTTHRDFVVEESDPARPEHEN